MQALRLARSATLPVVARTQPRVFQRALATAAVEVTTTSTQPASLSSGSSPATAIPLANVEAQWSKLTGEEKAAVHEKLETLQQKDWKELSLEEKKAAYYVAFGPHGLREPTSQPGDNLKIFLATGALVGAGGLLFLFLKGLAPPPIKSMSKEWQEASNERAAEMKLNPITGYTSEGYKGTGYVQSK